MDDLPDILYRYVFIDWQALGSLRLDKLGDVCSRAYVLVRGRDVAIPVGLVQQLHMLGDQVRWLVVETSDEESAAAVAGYELGLLDVQTDRHTEFVMSANWPGADALLPLLAARGRVVRLLGRQTVETTDNLETEDSEPLWSDDDAVEEVFDALQLRVYEELANDAVRQLMRQGERPEDLATLQAFIYVQNPELGQNGELDGVVKAMIRIESIGLENDRVVYHF